MIGAPAKTRICLVGEELSGLPDEGGRGFARQLSRALGEFAEVQSISIGADVPPTRTFLSRELRVELQQLDPSLVIYLPPASLTLFAVLRSRVLRSWARGARVAMVVHQPRPHGALSRLLIRGTAPDVIFSQDSRLVEYVRSLGGGAELLPPAVDLERFHPADSQERRRLRRAHDIESDAVVVLHVGHLKEERNLGVLKRLAEFASVVMVAGESTGIDRRVLFDLQAAGVRVVQGFVPRIEELYQLANCYVFPVQSNDGAIAMPLSVLEAMACDLPVVSTPFAALPEAFPSLTYAATTDELVDAVRRRGFVSGTRGLVEGCSWRALAERLIERALP
jgi:glycosyltransferase involved in cell wall biosynthesis